MVEWVLERFISLIGPLQALQRDKREQADEALRAVCTALTETRLYYRDMARGAAEDTKREDDLVRLWAAAAIPLRHLDEKLAEICKYKSQFWLDPRNWRNARAAEIDISLGNVQMQYEALMRPNKSLERSRER